MQSLATGNEDFPLLEAVDTGERKGRLLIVAWPLFFLEVETICIEM
jgi:hypothetical protein